MTFGGWCTFLISTISVTLLFLWCVKKVLSVPKNKDKELHGAFDADEISKDIMSNPKRISKQDSIKKSKKKNQSENK